MKWYTMTVHDRSLILDHKKVGNGCFNPIKAFNNRTFSENTVSFDDRKIQQYSKAFFTIIFH